MKFKNYWSHFGTHKKRTTQNNKLTRGKKTKQQFKWELKFCKNRVLRKCIYRNVVHWWKMSFENKHYVQCFENSTNKYPASCSQLISLFNPFRVSVGFHIETSHLFWSSTQMTGFYMKRNTRLKWVNLTTEWNLQVNWFKNFSPNLGSLWEPEGRVLKNVTPL